MRRLASLSLNSGSLRVVTGVDDWALRGEASAAFSSRPGGDAEENGAEVEEVATEKGKGECLVCGRGNGGCLWAQRWVQEGNLVSGETLSWADGRQGQI